MKIIHLLLGCLAITLTGCGDRISNRGGGLRNDPYAWETFTDTVDQSIRRELNHEPLTSSANWHDYWIQRCKPLYYNKNLGDRYIE